jgi:hypothetical protein
MSNQNHFALCFAGDTKDKLSNYSCIVDLRDRVASSIGGRNITLKPTALLRTMEKSVCTGTILKSKFKTAKESMTARMYNGYHLVNNPGTIAYTYLCASFNSKSCIETIGFSNNDRNCSVMFGDTISANAGDSCIHPICSSENVFRLGLSRKNARNCSRSKSERC